MEETSKKQLIYEKIIAIMKEIGAIAKNSENKTQNFMYRGIDAVMNALQPALIKNNVIMLPEVLSVQRTDRVTSKGGNITYSTVKMKYTFVATEDGSRIEVIMEGEGMDSGDKSTNKAMSAAYKYACFQTFCIPTEEMKDSDSESYETINPAYQQTAPSYPLQGQIYPQGGYAAQPQQSVQGYYPQADTGYQQTAQTFVSNIPAGTFPDVQSALSHICTYGNNVGKTMGQLAAEPRSGETLNWFIRTKPESLEAQAASVILNSRVM